MDIDKIINTGKLITSNYNKDVYEVQYKNDVLILKLFNDLNKFNTSVLKDFPRLYN